MYIGIDGGRMRMREPRRGRKPKGILVHHWQRAYILASEKGLYLNASREGTITLTEKHIECAEVCARLEITGIRDTKVMAQKWGVTRATIFGSLIVHLDS